MFNNGHVTVGLEVRRARLRWRAKRGLLENDILMSRFFDAYDGQLTDDEVYGLDMLLDLSDDDLLSLIMQRKEIHQLDAAEHLMSGDDLQKAAHVLGLLRLV